MDGYLYETKEAGQRLRAAREAAHCSQQELADDVAVNNTTISQWERGRNAIPATKIDAVARSLNVTPEWILFGVGPGPGDRPLRSGLSAPAGSILEPSASMRMMPYQGGPRDLPVYGSAQGGFDGEEVDITYPISYIPRPSQLAGASKAFAVYVVGNSMEPRYFPGEIVLCAPGKPIKKGDFVVVEFADHRAIVKQFISGNDQEIRLKQLNPDAEKAIPRPLIIGIHRIIGTLADG